MHWKYPFWTAFFLVLLRLAIGWHFCYEGYHKVHSIAMGETTTNKPFSSAGFFREAHGPLARYFQQAIGDPDDRLLERLTPAAPASARRLRMPSPLARDWEDYFTRFAAHYGLDNEQQTAAREKLEHAEADFVEWLTSGSKPVVKTFPTGTVDVTESNARRVDEYQEAVRKLRDTYAKELPALGQDVEKARLLQAKADVARLRTALEADITEQTAAMRKALASVLTDAQRRLGVVPEPEPNALLWWLDRVTAWFLFAVGATLLFGLFTRLSCVMMAGFLLTVYGVMPSIPSLPVPPNQEGNYYYVSKNVIEMLALLVLATTPSGRWFGVDALLHAARRAVTGKGGSPGANRSPSRMAPAPIPARQTSSPDR